MGDGNEREGPQHDHLFDDGHVVLTRLRLATRQARADGSYWREFAGLAAGKAAALCWRGNQHIIGALFAVGGDFDVMVPGDTEAPAHGATLVPYSVVVKWFDTSLSTLPGVLHQLHTAGARKLVVMATPPPKANSTELLRIANKSRRYIETARRAGVEAISLDCLTSLRSRYKLWRILQMRYAQMAVDCGATYMRHPDGVQDEDGALLPVFGSGDISHGNRAYGEKLLHSLVTHLKETAV